MMLPSFTDLNLLCSSLFWRLALGVSQVPFPLLFGWASLKLLTKRVALGQALPSCQG